MSFQSDDCSFVTWELYRIPLWGERKRTSGWTVEGERERETIERTNRGTEKEKRAFGSATVLLPCLDPRIHGLIWARALIGFSYSLQLASYGGTRLSSVRDRRKSVTFSALPWTRAKPSSSIIWKDLVHKTVSLLLVLWDNPWIWLDILTTMRKYGDIIWIYFLASVMASSEESDCR